MLTHAPRGRARLRAFSVAVLLLSTLGLVGTAAPAEAAMSYRAAVVHEASRHAGAPYKWGAAGPSRFDCSGFTQYVFARFRKSLPHNSAQQYASVGHVAKSQLAAGDLLFFKSSSGRISHVAIYAGSGYMWHASSSGSYVKRAKIYTTNYLVGRP